MENKYVWAVEDIYKSISDWQKDYDKINKEIDFEEFKGKLGTAQGFLSCMKKEEEIGRVVEKLGVYAMMMHDSDTRNAEYDALNSKINALYAKFSFKTAFIGAELVYFILPFFHRRAPLHNDGQNPVFEKSQRAKQPRRSAPDHQNGSFRRLFSGQFRKLAHGLFLLFL